MSERVYEAEWAVAQIFAQYLDEVLPAENNEPFQKCPCVTFFDPMAQDEADRVVIFIHQVDAPADGAANFVATVEVTIKSRNTQPKMEDDVKRHFARVKLLRGALCDAGMLAALDGIDSGLGVNYVNNGRQFRTDVAKGWIYSETRLEVKCFAREVTP